MPRVAVSGTFSGDASSATFTAKAGSFSIFDDEAFSATVTLEASVLGGANWVPCIDPLTGDTIALTGNGVVTFNFEVPLLLRLTCDWTSGTVGYEATGANFS